MYACRVLGLICTETEMFNRRDEIDSSSELQSMIQNRFSSDSSFPCIEDVDSIIESVPWWRSGECYHTNSNRSLDEFDCQSEAPFFYAGRDKIGSQGICYCHIGNRIFFKEHF